LEVTAHAMANKEAADAATTSIAVLPFHLGRRSFRNITCKQYRFIFD
jgi:hypothetical protein